MFRHAGKGAVLTGAVLLALAGGGVALAASEFAPSLGRPNHRSVRAGRIRLEVRARAARSVFVFLRPQRKVRHGHLVECVSAAGGCLVARLSPVRHHAGLWSYRAPDYRFPGFWATTARRYYWQAEAFTKSPPCSGGRCYFYSRIGSFRVVR